MSKFNVFKELEKNLAPSENLHLNFITARLQFVC